MCAVVNGHTECVRLLLDAGADKEAKDKVQRISVASFSFLFEGFAIRASCHVLDEGLLAVLRLIRNML